MLIESAVVFPRTSWRWLLDAANQIVDPFDYRIWDSIPPGQGVNAQPLVSTNVAYQLAGNDQDAVNGFHANRLGLAVGALPHNNHLQNSQVQVTHYKNVLNTVAEAHMNMAGASVPVTRSGLNAVAGTLGAGPCLAVVARATGANVLPAVACVHLSSNDMDSLAHAYTAINNLRTQLLAQLNAAAITCQCYLAGGSTVDDDEAIEEYARAFAACEQVEADHGMQLAGAVVPAAVNDGDFVDIFITPNAIYYAVDNNDNYTSSSEDDI